MQFKEKVNKLSKKTKIYILIFSVLFLYFLFWYPCVGRFELTIDCASYWLQGSSTAYQEGVCFPHKGKSKIGTPFTVYLHSNEDMLSNAVRLLGRWYDCDALESLFLETKAKNYLDIGGFVGLCVSVIAGHKVPIDTFEVSPHTANCLKQTIGALPEQQRKQTILHQVGLSNAAADDKSVVMRKNHQGGNFIQDEPDPEHKSVTVKTVVFDEYAPTKKVYDLVKMDVEGYECKVLCGARKSILKGNWKFIQIEIVDAPQYSCNADERRQVLEKLGFVQIRQITYDVGFLRNLPLLDYQFEWKKERVAADVNEFCNQF